MKYKNILGLFLVLILSSCTSTEKICDLYIPTVSVFTYAKIKATVDNDNTIIDKESVTDERYQLRHQSETGRSATDKNLERIKEMYKIQATQTELKQFKAAQYRVCDI